MTGRPPLPRLARWLLTRMVPAEWRDSILGDAEEAWPASGWRAFVTALAVAVRLAWARRGEARPARSRLRLWSLDELAADLRQAVRSLVRHRAYAITAIATLALGLGANVSVFSLANQVLLRPIPGLAGPDRVVSLMFSRVDGFTSWFSMPAIERLRTEAPAISDLTAYGPVAVHVAVPGGAARRVEGQVVTAGFFDLLGAAIGAGRGFTGDESEHPGAAPALVVSDRFWRRELGGTASTLGREVVVNGTSWTIVGIAAAGFNGPSRNGTADVWMPFGQYERVWPWYGPTLPQDADSRVFAQVIGRLAPGATVNDAGVQADAVRARLSALNPADTMMARARFVARPGVHAGPVVEQELARTTLLLGGIVALVLLLTCANVGSLMLAQGVSRRHDIVTRLALGATRARVARLLFVESLLLSVGAGAVSVALAVGVGRLLGGAVVLRGLPPIDTLAIDARVLGAALVASLIAALACGVLPAFAGSRADVHTALRASGRSQAPARARWTSALTAVQVAVSLALLIGSLLLVRSMTARRGIDPGFTPDRVVEFSVDPPTQGYKASQIRSFFPSLLERVRVLPGVRAAGYVRFAPFSDSRVETFVTTAPGSETKTSALLNTMSDGYIAALGATFVEGGDLSHVDFTPRPAGDGRPVVITRSLARTLFGTNPAVGRQIYLSVRGNDPSTVTGVIADVRHLLITEPAEPMVLQAAISSGNAGGTIAVGVAPADAYSIVPRLRDAVAAIDPTLPIFDVRVLSDVIAGDLAQDTLVMRLASVFATLACLLAAVGLYGVLARGVADRRRELSIRVALGARPATIARVVTTEALRVGAVGVALGLAATMWLSRYLETWLYGVGRFDPVTLVASLILIGTVLAASALVPARRAARIDVTAELR